MYTKRMKIFYQTVFISCFHIFQETRARNCDTITNALSFNNEPQGDSQDASESDEAVDINETDDEEEETMSLSM